MKTKMMVIAIAVVILISELQVVCFASVMEPQDYTRFTQDSETYENTASEKVDQLAWIVVGSARRR